MRQNPNFVTITTAYTAVCLVAASTAWAMPLPGRTVGDDAPDLITLIQGAEKKGPPGKGSSGPLAAAARELGISERELADAVGPAPPNVERGAKALGIPPEKLREVLEKHRPPSKKQ